MASSSRHSEEGQKRTYWYQCTRLLIEGSLPILKEFLTKHCKGQLDSFLNTNKGILQRLQSKRILYRHQIKLLFPHADLESFDITLITCILLNCQPTPQPAQEQFLKEIRDLRNRLHAHISSLSLEENEFNYNWGLIRNCLSNAENVFGVNTCLHELVDKVREDDLGNIERFRDELNAWKCSDDKILSALEEILKKQTKCSRKLDDVAENVEEIKARLPKRFKEEGDEVNKEVTDEVWKELQHCLMNDYKKLLIKAPISANESLSYETDIEDIYAEPKLLLVDYTAQTKETCNKNQKSITPKDIFPSDRNKCSNIYVTGDAGMGKTSLCKYILSAWCKAQQKGETGKDDFVLALEQYDFAFYIPLRHAKRQDYMTDMIVSKRLQHIVLNNHKLRGFQPKFLLDEVLRLNSEKCLIILDGWDEWRLSENVPSENDGIPLRDPHLNYTILTTTRPWKLEQLRLKESRIDKLVKITGVEDTKMFSEKLILCNNKREKRNETYDSFNQCLLDNGVTELRETPILLKYLVCLWFQNQSVGNSKTEIYTNMINLWLQNAANRKGVSHVFSAEKDIDDAIKRPEVFKKYNQCDRHTTLLKAVGKLAYETATQEKVIQLVFDSTEEHGITEDLKSICLDVGILTQSVVPDMTCERKSISFPHKTFHEFFAALYMGWYCSEPGVNTYRTIEGLLEYERENMCIFLSAMWPSLFESLLEGKFLDYNKCNDLTLLMYVQELMVKCCTESIAVNNYCPKVNFKHIALVDVSDDPNTTYEISGHQPHVSESKLFFVLAERYKAEIWRSHSDSYALDFSKVFGLKNLDIYKRKLASLAVSPSLCSLIICKVIISTPNGVVDLLSSIAKAKDLKRLVIEKFKTPPTFPCSLDLSNNRYLSILSLNCVYADKLNVSLNITELTLNNVRFTSHKEMISLMQNLPNLTRLNKLTLIDVYCSEHEWYSICFLEVDFLQNRQLKYINLEKMSFCKLSVNQFTKNLKFYNIQLASHKVLVSLMRHLSNLTTLKTLELARVYCRGHKLRSDCFLDVDFLKKSTLRVILLQEMFFSKLSVSTTTQELTLLDIQLESHEVIESLMRNVSNLTKLRRLKLAKVYCRGHELHSDCFLDAGFLQKSTMSVIQFQDMSFSKLSVSPTTKELVFVNIILESHEVIDSLMRSVSNLTTLKKVALRQVYCYEHKSHEKCFLDVDLAQSPVPYIFLKNISLRNLVLSQTTNEQNLILFYCQNIKFASRNALDPLHEEPKKYRNNSLVHVYCIGNPEGRLVTTERIKNANNFEIDEDLEYCQDLFKQLVDDDDKNEELEEEEDVRDGGDVDDDDDDDDDDDKGTEEDKTGWWIPMLALITLFVAVLIYWL